MTQDKPVLSIATGLTRGVRLGLVSARPIAVAASSPLLLDETEQLRAELSQRFAGRQPSEIAELQPARELYRRFGIDPTKTRPSSEALLRRVLRDRPLPRISNAVDLCNLLSLSFLLPLGLYDADRIEGEVELRPGAPGESFAGIRKTEVHLEGRPALVDGRGPFGNPTSDSLRTCVTDTTTSLWLVIFAPASVSSPALSAHVATARESMTRHLGATGGALETAGEIVS